MLGAIGEAFYGTVAPHIIDNVKTAKLLLTITSLFSMAFAAISIADKTFRIKKTGNIAVMKTSFRRKNLHAAESVSQLNQTIRTKPLINLS